MHAGHLFERTLLVMAVTHVLLEDKALAQTSEGEEKTGDYKAFRSPLLTNTNTSSDDVIIVGGLFPLHQWNRGFAADEESQCAKEIQLSGFQRMEAMRYAIDEINRKQVIPGVKLAYEMRDTCTSQTYTLRQAVEFLNHAGSEVTSCTMNLTTGSGLSRRMVSAIIGAAASGSSIEAASFLRLFRIPQISYASTSAELSDKDQYTYFMRTVPPDNFQAKAIMAVVRSVNASFLSLLHSPSAYGEGGANVLRAEVEKSPSKPCLSADAMVGSLSGNAEEAQRTHREALNQLTHDVSSRAAFAVLFTGLKDAQSFFRTLARSPRSDRLNQKLTWIGSDAFGSHKSLTEKEYLGLTKGMLGVVPKTKVIDSFMNYFLNLDPTDDVNLQNPWFAEFWEREFNCRLDDSNATRRAACAKHRLYHSTGRNRPIKQDLKVPFVLDAVNTLAAGIRQLQLELCPNISKGVCSEMLTLTVGSRQGSINGEKLLEALKRQRLRSTVGYQLTFNPEGDPATAVYDIQNLRRTGPGDGYHETVGSWERLAASEQPPLGKTWHNGELTVVECYNVIDRSPSCTRSRLRLNFTNLQWHDGSEGKENLPISQCSSRCPPGHFARPLTAPHLKNVQKCCWTCQRCADNFYTTSQFAQCKECPYDTASLHNRTGCQKLPVEYFTIKTAGGIVVTIITAMQLVISIPCIIFTIIGAKAIKLRAALKTPELLIVETATVFLGCSLAVHLQRPTKEICVIQNAMRALFSTVIAFTLFVNVIFFRLKIKEEKEPKMPPPAPPRKRSRHAVPSQGSQLLAPPKPRLETAQSDRSSLDSTSSLSDVFTDTQPIYKSRTAIILSFMVTMSIVFLLVGMAGGTSSVIRRIVPHELHEIKCSFSPLSLIGLFLSIVPYLCSTAILVTTIYSTRGTKIAIHRSHQTTLGAFVVMLVVTLISTLTHYFSRSYIAQVLIEYCVVMVYAVTTLLAVVGHDLKVALLSSVYTKIDKTEVTTFGDNAVDEDNRFYRRLKETLKRDSLLNQSVRREYYTHMMRTARHYKEQARGLSSSSWGSKRIRIASTDVSNQSLSPVAPSRPSHSGFYMRQVSGTEVVMADVHHYHPPPALREDTGTSLYNTSIASSSASVHTATNPLFNVQTMAVNSEESLDVALDNEPLPLVRLKLLACVSRQSGLNDPSNLSANSYESSDAHSDDTTSGRWRSRLALDLPLNTVREHRQSCPAVLYGPAHPRTGRLDYSTSTPTELGTSTPTELGHMKVHSAQPLFSIRKLKARRSEKILVHSQGILNPPDTTSPERYGSSLPMVRVTRPPSCFHNSMPALCLPIPLRITEDTDLQPSNSAPTVTTGDAASHPAATRTSDDTAYQPSQPAPLRVPGDGDQQLGEDFIQMVSDLLTPGPESVGFDFPSQPPSAELECLMRDSPTAGHRDLHAQSSPKESHELVLTSPTSSTGEFGSRWSTTQV